MQVNFTQVGLVAIGGMLGSALRFTSGLYIAEKTGGSFPWATLIINITGSLLAVLVLGYFGRGDTPQQFLSNENWRLLLAAGFSGGFTTFSTFSNESLQLVKQQQYLFFFIYFTTSVLFGILAAALGYIITR